jgi:hypothetical protein
MALPKVGDRVTVVVEGTVIGADPAMPGLFDVDYGPGWVTVAEGQLLENSTLVGEMLRVARRGLAWKSWDPVLRRPRCPRCLGALSHQAARVGGLCARCRKEITASEATRDAVEMALDYMADHLGDAGLDKDEVWRVLRDKRDEIVQDATR